jgi:hypothetical protein
MKSSWSSFLQFWWELSNECNINTTVSCCPSPLSFQCIYCPWRSQSMSEAMSEEGLGFKVFERYGNL